MSRGRHRPLCERTRQALAACLAASLASCAPWTVRPIESGNPAKAATPGAFVESIWASRLVPHIVNHAVEARALIEALAASPAEAERRFGHREGSGPCHFAVKGRGRVVSIDAGSRHGLALVDLAPYEGRAEVSLQIGPVLRGNALRDVTGLVPFSGFVNQLEFADAGNELNARVLKSVLAPVDKIGRAHV
jgi:predicted lipoprotein